MVVGIAPVPTAERDVVVPGAGDGFSVERLCHCGARYLFKSDVQEVGKFIGLEPKTFDFFPTSICSRYLNPMSKMSEKSLARNQRLFPTSFRLLFEVVEDLE